MESYKVLKNTLSTEKSVRIMETENKLSFEVNLKSNKSDIKKAVEEVFNVKVQKVNTLITPQGKKRAIVKLSEGTLASDIIAQLGLV